ncbi:hypothetical protein UB43_25090 [Pseudomonas sp. 21]|uniref:hypothetical protein n=1 Tax=unclassified Pseudomonas TaxID=196821 RepID=UPI0005EB0A49|nr:MULTISPECIES: hypothetical protein [unclassified Pseudomonas]KJJ97134.1 hypothetical protein UB43_25090 [Pseudomonas sp. 21]MBV7583128.1 hypothetical protein [Pseudomonas sp. PDM33]
MSRKPSQAQLSAVLSQLTETDFKSIGDLAGPREANLFTIRELFRQGLIKGVLIDDPFGAADEDGPLLCSAERLRLRKPCVERVAEERAEPLTPRLGFLTL